MAHFYLINGPGNNLPGQLQLMCVVILDACRLQAVSPVIKESAMAIESSFR